MSVFTQKRETQDTGLRLVEDLLAVEPIPVEQQFVNFTFYRVNADWRKLPDTTKQLARNEFREVFDSFRDDLMLFSYSLVGFDAKSDLMFWRIGRSLDLIQEMTTKLYQTTLGNYLEPADNYLAVTKNMMFVADGEGAREQVLAGSKKYHFVYPCAKSHGWSDVPADQRDQMIEENFMVGKRFPNIKIHMTHAFGFSDEEYLISFETDEPKDFLALAEELRQTPASKFTMRGLPIYTCRQRSLTECLESLG
jgi:chlorite dismutase